jgi:uncharacterized delta-60 repeat protein
MKVEARRVATAAALLLGLSPGAAPSDLDPSFGSNGIVLSTDSFGNAVAIQADGKIVVGGVSESGAFAVMRYETNGSQDQTFGIGGRVTTAIGIYAEVNAVAVQGDGRIVAAGIVRTCGPCAEFALARYNPNGTLDASFGTGGVVLTFHPSFDLFSEARGVAIQPDGRIVVAGYTGDRFLIRSNFVVLRYNKDGSLDTTFGSEGGVTTNFGGIDIAYGMALRADGEIVVAGGGGRGGDFALSLYRPDGSLDPAFGTGGRVTTDFGGDFDHANAVVLQADGRIVLAGDGDEHFALARYDASGNLDPGFGVGGRVTVLFRREDFAAANGVAVENRKIVAAGLAGSVSHLRMAVARLESDGTPDVSFGDAGRVETGFVVPNVEARGVAVQADGKIVAAGKSETCTPFCFVVVARYLRLASANFYTLAPCRVVDTRGLGAPIGGPALEGQETRTLAVAGECGIPATAKAIAVNATVVQPGASGNLRLFPAGETVPGTSTVNYAAGQVRANNAIVELGEQRSIAAFVGQPPGTSVHLVLDVTGYFQ